MKTLLPTKKNNVGLIRKPKKRSLQPKTPRAKNGRYVTIYLSAPFVSHYEREAITLQTTVGKLLKKRVESAPISFSDRMKKFIGSAESGPSDLSTNPAYFEGFGEDIQPAKCKK